MEKEIKKLYKIIKDYRIDEGLGVSEKRILNWVNQFAQNDRVFILTELEHVMSKMYFSRMRVKQEFLKVVIDKLKERFNYKTYKELLDNTVFLDLQGEEKSQKALLILLQEVLVENYQYDFKNIGCNSQRNYVYLDDVLCTGNTFFKNLRYWANKEGEDRLKKLRSKEINLNVFYIFIAREYYKSKCRQFSLHVSKDFQNYISIISLNWINKEILKPVKTNTSSMVLGYKSLVETKANEYANENNFSSYYPNFYRSEYNSESFFSSIDNRKRIEQIFLHKGIEILNNSKINKYHVRPLGFSLPAYKDFGFGALIFTWRNVANNTPLVFWYKNRNFMPLFINKR